jgi:D-alanyl-D-alanine carboxypeptidase (penicillin-binding protein 5/6)
MLKMELHRAALCAALFCLLTPTVLPATAAVESADVSSRGLPPPADLTGDFTSAIVIDADTGWVLAAHDAETRRQPASMLKMMTELIVLQRIAEGDFSLADTVTVSARASVMGGSPVYLKQGERFTVEELLAALAIHSANDAAVALAEHVAGSVEAFVDLMNSEAKELGMNDSTFHSVHGLPPGRGQKPDLTTAHDLAILGRELIRYPEARTWASTKTMPFRNGEFELFNPNQLVGKYRGLDGIKTGYHSQAGFCVTASALQKGTRLISVVMGAASDRARATETTRLLSYGFSLYTSVPLVDAGQAIDRRVKVKGGKRSDVAVAYAEPLTVNVPKVVAEQITLKPEFAASISAPLEVGDVVGQAVATLDGHPFAAVPIVATEAVEKGNWFDRLFH